jgi:hypothetical protein
VFNNSHIQLVSYFSLTCFPSTHNVSFHSGLHSVEAGAWDGLSFNSAPGHGASFRLSWHFACHISSRMRRIFPRSNAANFVTGVPESIKELLSHAQAKNGATIKAVTESGYFARGSDGLF